MERGLQFLLLKHETTMKYVVEFMQHKSNQSDILLKEITPDFIREYEHYLRTVKNIANNTTVKYIRNTGKILRLAEQKEIIKKLFYWIFFEISTFISNILSAVFLFMSLFNYFPLSCFIAAFTHNYSFFAQLFYISFYGSCVYV